LRIRPHLTDDDLRRGQESIVALQRGDVALLTEFAHALWEHASHARATLNAPVVLLCNTETEEVIPSPLDWEEMSNVHQLDIPVYQTAKRALHRANPDEEIVVLLYHPTQDVLSIYTLSFERDERLL